MLDIVMVPFHDYKKWLSEGFRTRDAHVFEHLSKEKCIRKILVIDRPTSIAEILLNRKKWNNSGGIIEYKRNNVQLLKIKNNIWCLDFLLLDFLKVAKQKKMWWFTAFNYEFVSNAINEAISFLNMKGSILLLQNPMAIGVTKTCNCKYFVFDAIDNWIYHPQMPDKKLIQNNYEYINQNADLIITVSKALLGMFPKNKNLHWIPNGVDVNYFYSAVKQIPTSNKVVGYVGKIQDRVDFDLVEDCLKRFKNTQFVFLGPIYTQREKVRYLSKYYDNVAFKGDIHYSRLPDEMKKFDVAIIPHKVDLFTNSMNPIKLYEYLAAGKPVVTTDVAGTSSISPYVKIAKDSADFIIKLNDLLKEQINSKDVIDSIPDECTWDNRVKNMIELMNKLTSC